MSQTPLLEFQGICKVFPGVRALDNVNFKLDANEVHALVGENGAGKSTLIKILSGVYQADQGTILLKGQPVSIHNPTQALKMGIIPVHQELNLQPFLSVAENIFIGRQPKGRFGLIDYRQMYRLTSDLLSSLAVSIDPAIPLGMLSAAERQMIAIARAVSLDAQILIFDEPTSSLTDRETEILFSVIRKLKSKGISMIYITHRLAEIFQICDRLTVMRDGQYINTLPVSETSTSQVINMMIGRTLNDLYKKEQVEIREPILEVSHLTKRGVLQDISFTVRRGEIVGIAGLVGAGRTELARAIFGDLEFDSGRILVDGKPIVLRLPSDAIQAGIGLVPEDRKEQGLVLGYPVGRNITLGILSKLTRAGLLESKKENQIATDYIKQLAIRTPSPQQGVQFLSGGNQQRVVIAKWLATHPKVLILDEPTRGVDVGAKAEIHALMSSMTKEGVGILMISSDLPEILAMSDRILVMHQGQIKGELSGNRATQEEIMRYATGHAESVPAS